jgi:integrase
MTVLEMQPRSRKRRRRSSAPAPSTPDVLAALTAQTGTRPSSPPPNARHRAHTAPIVRPATLELVPAEWLDARGHRRAIATMPGYGKGRAPASKGKKYPRNPPTSGEMMRLLGGCPQTPQGRRLFALLVLLWRSGLRVAEALALVRDDLDVDAGSITVRHGKGDEFRCCGMDRWGWTQFTPWLRQRTLYPDGAVFCVLEGPTSGRAWCQAQVRHELHRLARSCGIAKRITPHQLRHAFAEERKREGMTIDGLGVQLGHRDPKSTYRYIGRPTSMEVVEQMRTRAVPQVPLSDAIGGFDGWH